MALKIVRKNYLLNTKNNYNLDAPNVRRRTICYRNRVCGGLVQIQKILFRQRREQNQQKGAQTHWRCVMLPRFMYLSFLKWIQIYFSLFRLNWISYGRAGVRVCTQIKGMAILKRKHYRDHAKISFNFVVVCINVSIRCLGRPKHELSINDFALDIKLWIGRSP